MSGDITTPIQREAEASVMDLMRRYSAEFAAALPPQFDAKRCGGLVKIAIAQNPRLAGCTAISFVNAVLTSAALGLEIRRNSCYLIPYGKECQLVIDYHGKMELARRAGVGAIHVELVRDGDDWDYGFGPDGLVFRWKPGRERGEITDAFVSAKINGSHQLNLMTLAEIEAIRRRAKAGAGVDFQHYGKKVSGLTLAQIRQMDVATMAFNDPYRLPWVTDYDRMARKTAIHRAANDWPQTAQLLHSQECDVALDTGASLPPANEGMGLVLASLDPEDNKPMVDGGGDTYAEQKQSVAKIGAELLAKAEARRSGPPVSKEQLSRMIQSSGQISGEAFREILQRHYANEPDKIRQSDYDSVMAAIEEAAAR